MTALRTGEGLPDVVVTAVASTTALAADAEETWALLQQGRSGIRALDKWFIGELESPVCSGGGTRSPALPHSSPRQPPWPTVPEPRTSPGRTTELRDA